MSARLRRERLPLMAAALEKGAQERKGKEMKEEEREIVNPEYNGNAKSKSIR